LKRPGDALVLPPQWVPNPVSWENYPRLFTVLPFGRFFFNSIKISLLVVLGQTFICSLGGYGFARLTFRGKNIAFAILIGSLMMPVAVRIVPLYLAYKVIGWLDTHYPIIIAPVVANTFGTFLFRQFFMTVPDDLEDAAVIDGCNKFRVFWNVMIPMAGPVISTVAIFAFMHSWNNFLEPLIYLNRIQKFTVPIGLSFFQGAYQTEYTVLMAGATVAVMPILLIYFLAQDYFVKGIVTTGLKG
jgi:multiple sugar transport system permease protein